MADYVPPLRKGLTHNLESRRQKQSSHDRRNNQVRPARCCAPDAQGREHNCDVPDGVIARA